MQQANFTGRMNKNIRRTLKILPLNHSIILIFNPVIHTKIGKRLRKYIYTLKGLFIAIFCDIFANLFQTTHPDDSW